MAPGDELREVLREILTGYTKGINSNYDDTQINELVSKYNKLGLSAQDLKTNAAMIKGALDKSRNAVAIYVNLNDALQTIQEETMNDATLAQNSKPNMGPGDELKNELKRIVDETGNITSKTKKVIIENVIDILNLEGINLTVTDLKENKEELKDIITDKYISIAIRKETLGTKLKAISDEKKQKINEAPLNDIEKSAGSRASDHRVGSNSIGKNKPITASQEKVINSKMKRDLDELAHSKTNSYPKQTSTTNPFVNMALSDEEKFRKDIAEIIKSMGSKFDANTIVSLINLEGIDLSKIDLKNEDNKETLTEGVKSRDYVLSVDEESVARTLSTDLKRIADQVERIEIESAFDEFVHKRADPNNVKIPDNEDTQSVKSNDSRIPVSSGPSREFLSKDRKQAKHVTKAQEKENVQILKNSEIPEVRSVANELSEILRKGGSNAQKLANIINESDKKDFQKGCLRLYEDIENDIQPLAIIIDDQQTKLETKILEKLPERIKEAKYEKTLSFEKVENAIEKLVNGAKGGRLAYLKAEFSKLNVAGKVLAVAATAAAIAATPIVLGVGLAGTAVVGAAAPLAGAGYVANELKKAYDEEVRNERQESANTKKAPLESNPLKGNDNRDLTDLAKKLIDLAVFNKKVKMLETAIEQYPELRSKISKEALKIIKDYTTGKTGKQVREGEFYQALKGLNLNEDAAKKLLTLVENIKEPESEKLSAEEVRYFHALKELITTGLIALIKSIFSNKVINTGSKANEAFLSGIDKDKFPDVRDMLKNCSELDKAGGDQLYEALELKILEANQPEEPKLLEVNPSIDTLNIFNILDKRNPTDNELKLLKDAFNSLDPKDIKELVEKSKELLTQQKQEEKGKGFLDKAKSFLNITSTQKAAREEKSR